MVLQVFNYQSSSQWGGEVGILQYKPNPSALNSTLLENIKLNRSTDVSWKWCHGVIRFDKGRYRTFLLLCKANIKEKIQCISLQSILIGLIHIIALSFLQDGCQLEWHSTVHLTSFKSPVKPLQSIFLVAIRLGFHYFRWQKWGISEQAFDIVF